MRNQERGAIREASALLGTLQRRGPLDGHHPLLGGHRRLLLVVAFFALCACATAQHGHHPTMPGMKFFLHAYLGDGESRMTLDKEIELPSTAEATSPQQRVQLPAPWPAVTIREYLPNAELRQSVTATKNLQGHPAIELTIAGPTQSIARWLIAGDSDRNRLMSVIGTWRLMAVANKEERDSLLTQFRTELTRDPVLRVARSDGTGAVALRLSVGESAALEGSDCSVTLVNFFPHYGRDEDSSLAVNQSKKRINPAAHVELECDGARERRWVFSKFPNYSLKGENLIPLHVVLDCPAESTRETPAYLLVVVGRKSVELWSRFKEEASERTLSLDTWAEIADSQYKFRMKSFVADGKLMETFEPATKGGGPAIKVAMTTENGAPEEAWLSQAKAKTFRTSAGPITLVFDSSKNAAQGGH